MNVNVYSLKKDGNRYVSAHFRVREFRCRDGSEPVFVSPELVQILEKIRAHFGRPVIINSAYRTPEYNAKVDGSPTSQHLYGLAADIRVNGVAPSRVASYARSILPHHGGVGRYRNFTHVDVRANVANWEG